MSKLLPYVLSTTISGVPHCVKCNVGLNKFELMPVKTDSDLGRVFTSPDKTMAVNILNWINKNDKGLARRKLEVSPEASIR